MTKEHLSYAKMFKEHKISLAKLKEKVPEKYFKHCDNKVTVYIHDLKELLNAYLKTEISKDTLLDWVNTVWFSELFCYDEAHCDSIACVMNELEEADERDNVLDKNSIQRYIDALNDNQELE